MARTSLTPEAQQLIASTGLGPPIAVYKPDTGGDVFWAVFITVMFTGGFGGIPAAIVWWWATPASVWARIVFGIGSPCIEILVGLVGVGAIISARRNRHNRAFVCVNGAGYLTRTSTNAARWEDILMVTHETDVSTSTTPTGGGGTTSTSGQPQLYRALPGRQKDPLQQRQLWQKRPGTGRDHAGRTGSLAAPEKSGSVRSPTFALPSQPAWLEQERADVPAAQTQAVLG